MSYDIYLEIHTGKEFHTVVDVGNHTSNTVPMWELAIGKHLGDFDGCKASEAITPLQNAIVAMRKDPEKFKKLNPGNGWGSYETALQYLIDILEACEKHPNTTISISR